MRLCDACGKHEHSETPYYEMHVEIRKWTGSGIEAQKNAGGDFCSIKCINDFVGKISDGIIARPSN